MKYSFIEKLNADQLVKFTASLEDFLENTMDIDSYCLLNNFLAIERGEPENILYSNTDFFIDRCLCRHMRPSRVMRLVGDYYDIADLVVKIGKDGGIESSYDGREISYSYHDLVAYILKTQLDFGIAVLGDFLLDSEEEYILKNNRSKKE